jgi:HEAT repeat protein
MLMQIFRQDGERVCNHSAPAKSISSPVASLTEQVREHGGIPPLVGLLEALDLKVQRAAAGALRTLAFKNEENKNQVCPQPSKVQVSADAMQGAQWLILNISHHPHTHCMQIVECGALPILIQMLRSDDSGVHYEAVGVIGNLVHSSQNIKRKVREVAQAHRSGKRVTPDRSYLLYLQVLEEGALQPVIGLLASSCPESQREAALLLGQFATTDADTKVGSKAVHCYPTMALWRCAAYNHSLLSIASLLCLQAKIVQRGAVPLLVSMLSQTDNSLKEMAAFALGRLAQNSDNQAGIVQCGGLVPLLELLESKHCSLQHNAAFAL